MKEFLKELKKSRTLLLMLAPAVVIIFIFAYLPMGGMVLAFKQYNYRDGIWGSPWVTGIFDNFRFFFMSGKAFAVTANTFSYNLCFIAVNTFLAVLFAGLMIGGGIGIVLRAGASTGGMDIPPLVLNKKFGISVSGSMNVMDTGILLLQMVFSDRESVLYGILLVLTYTTVLNKVLQMGQAKMQVKIVSSHYEEINHAIATQLDRGVTLLKSVTGYLKQDGYVVMSVVSHRELVQLNRLIQEIDPHAFIVVNQVNEVRGRGFTMKKKYDSDMKKGN